VGSEENAVGAALREYLDYRHMLYHRIQCGLVRARAGWIDLGDAGWPDYMILPGEGLVWFAETKASHGVLKPGQAALHERLRAANYRVVVPRSVADVAREIGGTRREKT